MTNDNLHVGERDCVQIAYKIWHQDILLESSSPDGSVAYQMGEGQWPLYIEKAMCGQMLDARLKLELHAKDNIFGEADPERIMSLLRSDFDAEPTLGGLTTFTLPEGDQIEGQVLSICADKINVDFNHPYVGRDLHMEIHILAINNQVVA